MRAAGPGVPDPTGRTQALQERHLRAAEEKFRAGRKYEGVLRIMYEQKGFGFVKCAAVFEKYSGSLLIDGVAQCSSVLLSSGAQR